MAEPFGFERRARSPRALAFVAATLAGLATLALVVDAAAWIVGLVALLTVPAIWDALRDARARLVLDDAALSWSSGGRGRSLRLALIEEVTLHTSLDFSQRAQVRLTTGERFRIPPECVPPGRALDAALDSRGIPNRRSLFGF